MLKSGNPGANHGFSFATPYKRRVTKIQTPYEPLSLPGKAQTGRALVPARGNVGRVLAQLGRESTSRRTINRISSSRRLTGVPNAHVRSRCLRAHPRRRPDRTHFALSLPGASTLISRDHT